MQTRDLFPLVLCGLIGACAGAPSGAKPSEPADGSATVIRGSEFSGTVLEGLRTRYPAARISTEGSVCPRIMFRGQRSLQFQGNPGVYVDGTLMSDTCVLTQITSLDVDFIEVYPSGITSRATVQRNPFGLILVFRRKE
ncbi:MAG TPA: hypothetical protein VF021_10815 [Longimicrobiales bacterium]